MAKIIGIDLGTSNSASAYMEAGKPKIIPSAEGTTLVGGKAFPSYVAFTKEEELLVGEPARRQAVANPEGTVTAAKRRMGTDHKYKIYEKEYTPQQISAFILQKIKKDSELYLGEKVEKAVITIPAYFDDAQRQATKDAGKIAGLEVKKLVTEPMAACLAYGLDKYKSKDFQQVLIFDLGAGTLDVTIMEFGGGKIKEMNHDTKKEEERRIGTFKTIAISGDTALGGTDMDEALIKHIINEFKKDTGINLESDKMATQRIKEAGEKAKIELSSALETEINLPFITATPKGPQHLVMKLTRAKLEELVKPTIERCRKPVEQALSDAKLTPQEVEKIILVGGPTRMPIVQSFIENIFEKERITRGVDPMECVAMGAAIQGAILAGEGEVKDVLLLDVTPLSLGIETLGAVNTILIPRNTTIPTSKNQVFSTAADNQTSVEVHVLQGERSMAADSKTLGRFILDGIPPAPRGVPQVEVTFDIDANGILNVKAKDKATDKEQSIRIEAKTGLSKEEIEKMQKEAETYSQEDRKKRELVDARNNADTLIYTTEKTLKEAGDKISENLKKEVAEKVESLKKAMKQNQTENIKQKIQEVSQVIQKVGVEMYQAKGKEKEKGEDKKDKKEEKGDVEDGEFKKK